MLIKSCSPKSLPVTEFETIFLKAPHSGTPEDQLMLQFQGMIAEYERAQI